MKQAFLSFLGLICAIPILCATPIIPTTEGMKLEYVVMDKNGKITGYMINTVTRSTESPEGTIVEIRSETFDKDKTPREKHKPLLLRSLITENEVITLKDSMIPVGMEMMNGTGIIVEGEDAIYPLDLQVGQVLTPYTIVFSMKNKKGNINKLATIKCTAREIIRTDELTTEAGSFECVMLASKMSMDAVLGISNSDYSEIWYAEGVGPVKTIRYSNKMKKEQESVLISVSGR